MIDEDKTFEQFGYRSTDLPPYGHSEVILVCEWCGKEYIRKMRNVGKGHFCSLKCAGEYRSKTYNGENTAMWKGGKQSHICEYCGMEYFVPRHRSDSRFCSHDCYCRWAAEFAVGAQCKAWKGGKILLVCKECGKEYYVHKNRECQMFCSRSCAVAWRMENMSGKNSPNWKQHIKICAQCGKEYSVKPSQSDKTKFCSRECKGQYASENRAGENSPFWVVRHVNICEQCGCEYDVLPAMSDKSRFCSMKCMSKWHSINIRGENSPTWKGGRSFAPYCEKFNETFRESIRDKFGRVCFLCGKTEKICGRRLSVHHVSYQKDCMCNGIKCKFVPLCASCHARTNFNRWFWQRLLTYALEYEECYSIDQSKPLLYFKS